jgi:hypothetical protein
MRDTPAGQGTGATCTPVNEAEAFLANMSKRFKLKKLKY